MEIVYYKVSRVFKEDKTRARRELLLQARDTWWSLAAQGTIFVWNTTLLLSVPKLPHQRSSEAFNCISIIIQHFIKEDSVSNFWCVRPVALRD